MALKAAGLIRDGTAGTWTAQPFLIKQNGKERIFINYKPLNARTKKFKFPLPQIDGQFDSFQGNKFFSVYDLRKGFNQLAVKESCKHKIGFMTPFGIFLIVWLMYPPFFLLSCKTSSANIHLLKFI